MSDNGMMYIPNTDYLNWHISQWERFGIEFYGISHTHWEAWETLSREDKRYIKHKKLLKRAGIGSKAAIYKMKTKN